MLLTALLIPPLVARIGAEERLLRKQFGGYSLRYIGAYNMGSANVRKLMASNMDPTIYPEKVLKNYRNFYKAAAKTESNRTPAAVKTVLLRAPKKLQTRAVTDKCGIHKCDAETIMPGWASS